MELRVIEKNYNRSFISKKLRIFFEIVLMFFQCKPQIELIEDES